MAEPIQMPFELRTRMGPGYHVLDGGSRSPWEVAIFRGEGGPVAKYRDTAVICAKTAEPIEMPFGLLARMDVRNPESCVRWGSRSP